MRRRRTSPVNQNVGLPNLWLVHSRPERPQKGFVISGILTGHMDALGINNGTRRRMFKGFFADFAFLRLMAGGACLALLLFWAPIGRCGGAGECGCKRGPPCRQADRVDGLDAVCRKNKENYPALRHEAAGQDGDPPSRPHRRVGIQVPFCINGFQTTGRLSGHLHSPPADIIRSTSQGSIDLFQAADATG